MNWLNRVIFVVAFILAAQVARSQDLMSADEAVSILLDPHGPSNDKMAAVRTLMKVRFAAKSPEEHRINMALVRQAHYDLLPVRELAREALANRVGAKKADDLIDAYDPSDQLFVEDFRLAVKGWTNAGDIPQALNSGNSRQRQNGMRQLSQLASDDPKHLELLEEPLKARLVAHLDRFDRVEPSVRSQTMILVDQLGVARAAAVPLILRASSDPGSGRRINNRIPMTDEKFPEHWAIIEATASYLSDPDPMIASMAWRYLHDQSSDRVERIIAKALARAVVRGEIKDNSQLTGYAVRLSYLIEALHSRLASAMSDEERLLLLKAFRQADVISQLDKSPDAREMITHLLSHSEESIAVAAAELLTTPKSKAIANDAIFKSIKAGKPISPAVLKLLKPDSESLTTLLLESAKAGSSAVVRSTALALVVTGIQGDAAKSELERLLRDRDADVRRSAALLLDTPQAHARVRVPDLLERIKSGSVGDRQVAARQLNELAIEPATVTAALVHAVDTGDFAARQGLVAALESANFSNQDPLEVLKQIAGETESSTARAYARAALRQLDLKKSQLEVKP